MHSEAKLDSALWGYLTRLDDSGKLEVGEATIEVELVGLNAAPGAMVITDRRVLFFRSNPLTRKAHLTSIPLVEITEVERAEARALIRKKGVIRIRQRTMQARRSTRSSTFRVDSFALKKLGSVIVDQRDFLLRGGTGIAAGIDAESQSAAESAEPQPPNLTVVVGRGVTQFVRNQGGRLFVWGEPIGGFEWMKASTNKPPAVEFVRFEEVDAFELYIQETLLIAGRLRLRRRWLPRASVVVDTGLVMGP